MLEKCWRTKKKKKEEKREARMPRDSKRHIIIETRAKSNFESASSASVTVYLRELDAISSNFPSTNDGISYVGIYVAIIFEVRRFSKRIPVRILNHSVQLASREQNKCLARERLLSANMKAEKSRSFTIREISVR